MAQLTIPNTPPASSVNPTDLVWIWQNGELLQSTVAQLVAAAQIGNTSLAPAPNGTIKSNISGGNASPADNTLSSILDVVIGSGAGNLLVRGASGWAALAPGSLDQVLMSNGPSVAPSYQSLPGPSTIGPSTILANITGGSATPSAIGISALIDALIGSTAGSLLVRDPSIGWTLITPGTSGSVLVSNGAGANPSFQSVAGTGTVTSVQVSGGSTGLTASGGPVTASGVLTLGGTLALASGGTGASTVAGAQQALGFGFLVNQAVTASSSSHSINYNSGADVSLTLSANVTSVSISNWPAAGQFGRIVLEITSTGSFTITGWPGTTRWNGGTAYSATASGRDTVLLTSNDGGSTFRGYVIGQALA